MIKMQVIGRLGKDCVVNTVNGKNVMNFTLAHSEKFKDSQGNTQEKTIWVDCAYWSDRTALAQYLTKGTQVFVEGQPEARSFQRNDGTPGSSLSLRVREVQLLGSKNDSTGGTSAYQAPAANTNAGVVSAPVETTEQVDDLPF
ncbi:MAG TPA: single-stranded DNA-binding protein [Chitinophagaceae bacterium]|jgi:single-strand DNA-binding protein|nr:single-stranded DNA-binding protein [Chitinophagaceae bacterium]HNA19246.1 single-stranded DNA-binding protein [Chitinophagaceae bacterium]HNF46084.1 single-stranded DNA-binding protein [Chitinophagaceae bacterium]